MDPDNTIELYGGVIVGLDADGDTVLFDEENEYEMSFHASEWDEVVDHIQLQRCRRMH